MINKDHCKEITIIKIKMAVNLYGDKREAKWMLRDLALFFFYVSID